MPRLIARSMVSSGTEASRAFWNMVRRVALALMSPPPSRAATSTWRISLANSLPGPCPARPSGAWWSPTWSDPTSRLLLASLPGGRRDSPGAIAVDPRRRAPTISRKQLVQPAVGGQLGVERRGRAPRPAGTSDRAPLAVAGRRPSASTSTPAPDPLDHGAPDEHGGQRSRRRAPAHLDRPPRTTRPGGRSRCGGPCTSSSRSDRWSGRPSATSVASRISPAQVPNAGMPAASRAASGSKSPEDSSSMRHRRRLAAGQHERVDAVQVRGRSARVRPIAPSSAKAAGARGRRPAGRGRRSSRGTPAGHQPRSASRSVERAELLAAHGLAEAPARPWPRARRRRSGSSPRRWPAPGGPGPRS